MQGLTVGHSQQDDVDLLPLQDLTRARVPFITHVGPFLWLDHHRPPLDRAKRGFCFRLNVRHFICLSTYLTITVTRLLPIVMKFVINVIGTKADCNVRGKMFYFPSVSKWRPIYGYFSQLRSFDRFSWILDCFDILIKTYFLEDCLIVRRKKFNL